jgi:hypothetical protein
MRKIKIGIIGASATSCILGILFKNKGYDVMLLEKSNNIGGAWQVDSKGSVFSNIIAPLNRKERKNFGKIVNFLKKFKIKFNKNYYKGLFTKKIINVRACNFEGLARIAKKKLSIKYKYEIKKIDENRDYVEINNKLRFDYLIYPKNVFVKSINILAKNDKKIILHNKIYRTIKSKHIRFFSKDLKIKSVAFNEEGIGPVDRLQISENSSNLKAINARIKLNWKMKNNKQIIRSIMECLNLDKILLPKFSYFVSRQISKENFLKIVKLIGFSKRLIYVNTNSMNEFVLDNFISKKKIYEKIYK